MASSSTKPIDAPVAPAAGLASILKQQSAFYDPSSPADAQFFPSEPTHHADSLPPPTEQDPEAAGAEDDYDDPDGALWSGPAARSVPTSVSGFRMRARSRSEIDRRSRELARERDRVAGEQSEADDDDARSRKSRRRSRRRRSGSSRRTTRSRRGSDASGTTTDGEGLTTDAESVRSRSRIRRGRRDASSGSDSEDDAERVGFFEGISNALRGRRSSTVLNTRPDASPARSRAGSIRSRKSTRSRARTPGYESDAVSARSAESGDDDDPYGPYGSDDDSLSTSSSTQSSSSSLDESGGPRRRRNNAGVLGLPGAGASDFFGESRIEFGSDSGDDDEMSELSEDEDEAKKGGKAAHQLVYIPDEDLPLRFVGLHLSRARVVAWWVGCVLSGGILWLLGRWLPNLWRNSTGRMGEFDKASYVVVEVRPPLVASSHSLLTGRSEADPRDLHARTQTHHHASQILPLQTLSFESPVPLSGIFPPSVTVPPAHREDVTNASRAEVVEDEAEAGSAGGTSGTATPVGTNGHGLAGAAPKKKLKLGGGPTVNEIKFLDYRYYRFLLHPDGHFRMVRCVPFLSIVQFAQLALLSLTLLFSLLFSFYSEWKDPQWSSLSSLRRGLTTSGDVALRTTLFGLNAIEIEAKTIGQLLMDEVLHPFYIFQIFSIALWSVDDYYCASCGPSSSPSRPSRGGADPSPALLLACPQTTLSPSPSSASCPSSQPCSRPAQCVALAVLFHRFETLTWLSSPPAERPAHARDVALLVPCARPSRLSMCVASMLYLVGSR